MKERVFPPSRNNVQATSFLSIQGNHLENVLIHSKSNKHFFLYYLKDHIIFNIDFSGPSTKSSNVAKVGNYNDRLQLHGLEDPPPGMYTKCHSSLSF